MKKRGLFTYPTAPEVQNPKGHRAHLVKRSPWLHDLMQVAWQEHAGDQQIITTQEHWLVKACSFMESLVSSWELLSEA